MSQPALQATGSAPAEPVPVAFLGRTSALLLQDPAASLRRQAREVQAKLPPGWFIAAWFWDIESGGLDLEQRGHGTAHETVDIGLPRDGGLAALLAEAAGPSPRFAAVMCEDIERSGRDTFNALKLERQLGDAGIPLFATDEPINVEGMNATTILIRRVKQGIAEWYRFALKEKAWRGFEQHTLDGYNIGGAPYGYHPERIPHPNPGKAAQGRTKTRLILDPQRAPVVAQIFTWRTADKLGVTTITNRLNADPAATPHPSRAGGTPPASTPCSAIRSTPGTWSTGGAAPPAAAGSTPSRRTSGSGHRSQSIRRLSPGWPGTPPRRPARSTLAAATSPAWRPTRPPGAATCCGRGAGAGTANDAWPGAWSAPIPITPATCTTTARTTPKTPATRPPHPTTPAPSGSAKTTS
jgi:DNA invertase Pin-like site-specific DNA recombinase